MSEKSNIVDAPAPPSSKAPDMKIPPALKVFDIHKVKVKRMRALYDFDSKEEWALKLKRGDIIEIVEQQEPDDPASQSAWWEGKVGEKTGLFPTNYCEVIELQPRKKIKIKTNTVSPSIKQLQTLCFPEDGRPRSNSAPEESTLPVHEEKPVVEVTTEPMSPVSIDRGEKVVKSATLRESRTTTKRSQKVQELTEELEREKQLLEKEVAEKKKFEDKYRIYKQKYLDSKKKRAKEQKELETKEAEKAEKVEKLQTEVQEQKKLEKLLRKESKKRVKVETQKSELENRMKDLEEELKKLKEDQKSPVLVKVETPAVGATPEEVRVMKAQMEMRDVEIENLKKQVKLYEEKEQAQKAQQEQQRIAELEKLASRDESAPSRNSSNMEALLLELEKEESSISMEGEPKKEKTYVRESIIIRPEELRRKIATAKQVFQQPKETFKPPPLPPISGKKTKDLIKAFEMKAAVQKLAEKNTVVRKSIKYTSDNLQHIPGSRIRSTSMDAQSSSPTTNAPITLATVEEIKVEK